MNNTQQFASPMILKALAFPTLGERLTLPAGWKYRTRTLDKDMTLTSSYDANPPNTIVLDQFEGNYQHNPYAP